MFSKQTQRTLSDAFAEADAKDAEENARIFARMRTAVEAAHELAGIESPAAVQHRLAFLLKWLHFAGGTSQRGSRAYVATMCEALHVPRRTLDRMLQRLRELDLIESKPGPRSTWNRLNLTWIAELVALRQGGAVRPEGGAAPPKSASKVAQHGPAVDVAQRQVGAAPPPKWRSDRERVLLKENQQPAAFAESSVRWGDVVDLLGQEGATAAVARMSAFEQDRVRRNITAGLPLPEHLVERLLDASQPTAGRST